MKTTISAQIATAIKSYRGNVRQSLIELASNGATRTGTSGYSKGWSNKSIWTGDVCRACAEIGLVVISGNDAPRGGANGEFVALVADKRKNRLAHKYQALDARRRSIARIRFAKKQECAMQEMAEQVAKADSHFALVMPLIDVAAWKQAQQLRGEEKNAAIKATFVNALQAAGNPSLVSFYDMIKRIDRHIGQL